MPFGKVGEGEYGTYFIGYCRTPRVTEQMIENMFIGKPPGNYDRLLDFSRAVTGTLFFVPSATFLDALGEEACNGRGACCAVDGSNVTVVGLAVGWFTWNRLPQRRKGPMNNLHRELAPISDAAWAQIEEEAKRTLKRYLAGRRVVDVEGPGGLGLSAIGTGHLKPIAAPGEGVACAPARRQASGRTQGPLRARPRADRRRRARLERLGLAAGKGRRAKRSPMPRIAPSSKATRPLRLRASGRGRAIRS